MIFSFLLLGIVALVVSVLLGIPFAIVASRIARRKALKHQQLIVFCAAVTPALFIAMEIVFGLIGSIYISEKKGVDVGFGDYWEAPLTESHYISAVDLPSTATIQRREDDRHTTDTSGICGLTTAFTRPVPHPVSIRSMPSTRKTVK